jgi:hypothetical protein
MARLPLASASDLTGLVATRHLGLRGAFFLPVPTCLPFRAFAHRAALASPTTSSFDVSRSGIARVVGEPFAQLSRIASLPATSRTTARSS